MSVLLNANVCMNVCLFVFYRWPHRWTKGGGVGQIWHDGIRPPTPRPKSHKRSDPLPIKVPIKTPKRMTLEVTSEVAGGQNRGRDFFCCTAYGG